MAGTLFVGIDVSGARNVACGMTQEGTELLRCTTVNDRPGAAELVRGVIATLTSHNLDRVVFGLEATGLLAWHLAAMLTLKRWPKRSRRPLAVRTGFPKRWPMRSTSYWPPM